VNLTEIKMELRSVARLPQLWRISGIPVLGKEIMVKIKLRRAVLIPMDRITKKFSHPAAPARICMKDQRAGRVPSAL
jgi:hypothetical protein